MITKIRNLTLASALLGTCLSAANIESNVNLNVSGDAEITYKTEDTDKTKNAYNETEVNLYVDAVNQDGIEFHSKFVVFDGIQADTSTTADNTANMETAEAYVKAPLMGGKVHIMAGLKENGGYGTDAFWSADSQWRTAITVPIAKGTTFKYVRKKLTEKKANDGDGDKDANVFRLDTKFNGYAMGVKYGQVIVNNNLASEKEQKIVGAYFLGDIAGIDTAFEYMDIGEDFDGTGYFLSLGKEFDNGLSVGLGYASLTDGMKGGSDFAVSEILDGNIDSSTTKDTSAIALPISYPVSDKLTANLTLVSADVLDESATEYDIGFEYALGEQTTLSGVYANISGDGVKALNSDSSDDYTVMNLKVSMAF